MCLLSPIFKIVLYFGKCACEQKYVASHGYRKLSENSETMSFIQANFYYYLFLLLILTLRMRNNSFRAVFTLQKAWFYVMAKVKQRT